MIDVGEFFDRILPVLNEARLTHVWEHEAYGELEVERHMNPIVGRDGRALGADPEWIVRANVTVFDPRWGFEEIAVGGLMDVHLTDGTSFTIEVVGGDIRNLYRTSVGFEFVYKLRHVMPTYNIERKLFNAGLKPKITFD